MATNEGTSNSDRPLETLLKLGTYQGMTDTEVESVLEYRVARRMKQEEFELKMQEVQEGLTAQAAAYQEMADNAMTAFNELVAGALKLRKYGDESNES